MSRSQSDPISLLQFFQDELNSDNVHHRIFAANNISLIAAAIGPEHTKTELINYLMQVNQLDGEVQMCLANCIGNLVKYVGESNAHLLLGPLKILAGGEEAIVRNKAIESMEKVCSYIQSDAILLQTTNDLATCDYFTSRSSASTFITKIYSRVTDPNKIILRGTYKNLINDSTPMVRRSSLQNLPSLCENLPPEILTTEIIDDFLSKVLDDDEDSVRLLVPNVLSVIADKINQNSADILICLCKTLVKDGSWRVRMELANELPRISKHFPIEVLMKDVWDLLHHLLKDPEAETKTSAIQAVSGILPLLKDQPSFVSEKMIKDITDLTTDNSSSVRREVSIHLMEFAPIVGNQVTISTIIPVFIQILHDNDYEACTAVLNSLLTHIDEVNLPAIVSAILNVILEISGQTKWRVKVVIVKLIPHFARVLGLDDFMAKLFPLLKSWLADDIFSVREAVVSQLPTLVQLFGPNWTLNHLIPAILTFQNHQNYLIREMLLHCVSKLQGSITQQVMIEQFFKPIVKMANDKVPNVKFMVAKTLLLFIGGNDPKVTLQVQNCLRTLASDPDTDVKYYACNAQLKCT